MWKCRSITHVGLAITDSFIRASVLTKKGKTLKCEKTETVALHQNSLTNALVMLRQSIGYRRQPTIVGMAYRDVMTKSLTVDASLTDSDIINYLTDQASRLFGYPADKIYFDYSSIKLDNTKQTLHVTIAHQQQVDALKNRCRTAGFNVVAVDVDVFALCRIAPFLSKETQAIGLVCVGSKSLMLCILENHHVVYATEADYPEKTAELNQFVIPSLHRALQFFSSTHPDKSLSCLFITGDQSSSQLANNVALETGLLTQLAAPSLLQTRHALLSAGLALWGLS